MEVIGITRNSMGEDLAPLDHRLQFNRHKDPTRGYFSLIAPPFQEFMLHGSDLEGLHVFARAAGLGLARGLELCSQVETNLLSRPNTWREYVGTIKRPGCPEMPLRPLIVRRRALSIIVYLRKLFLLAQKEKASVVFANGVFYMPLCGIKPTPGDEYYS